MKHYIGIDLGTTNSAICSFDGREVRIWKSPEQNDVTPSAIYVDRRGNRYFGRKAYNQVPYNPKNSAILFKRFMGTNTRIELEAAGLSFTPEECSAEILKVLFGYIPEEIRYDKDTATVITVPAAFNQMKKDATLEAARMAGIGKVALMQEPVAAIMSIMKHSNQEGFFLVYDLGGGTFDVSIAENIGGKVNLLAHGGIEMCGGRDIDRMIFSKIVSPWLTRNFSLPENLMINPKYKKLCRVAEWAIERAKIELSATEMSTIALSEDEARVLDENGEEIYLDINISREQINDLISDIVNETISATKETLTKAKLTANDIKRVIFIGGPTNYKPLRDKVSAELSMKSDIDVNPMTAVAEGACIFAESIDWSSVKHNRKAINEIAETSLDLSFKYTARTPNNRARVMCVLKNKLEGYTIQFESLDTGWISGQIPLKNKQMLQLPLEQKGDNTFKIDVCDEFGKKKDVGLEIITITRTLATIGAIPASCSIGMEVIDKLGGASVLEYLIKEGDSLPKTGKIIVKAGQTIKAGSNDSLNIKLWEGNIQTNIEDNRFIGVIKVSGRDIESGVIPTGADIECEYEMTDAGAINMEVSVPCIGAVFAGKNFYSRQEGQDSLNTEKIAEDGQQLIIDIEEISEKIYDDRLTVAKEKAENAAVIYLKKDDPEEIQKANNELLEAKKIMNLVRKNNQREFRQKELEECIIFFDNIRSYAESVETQVFENMQRTAQRAINNNDTSFANVLQGMWDKIHLILLRQDWYIADRFNDLTLSDANYVDKEKFRELKQAGEIALAENNTDILREIYFALNSIRIRSGNDKDMFDETNIIK